MNIKMLISHVAPFVFLVSVTTGSSAVAESSTSLNQCLDLEFKEGKRTAQDDWNTGECYLNLASLSDTAKEADDNAPYRIYSVHTASEYSASTFLQYADSWFQLAKHGNHPLASQRIILVHELLNSLN